jgi:hypothetical protein
MPLLKEALNINVKNGATTAFEFFISLTGILSGPADLNVFNLLIKLLLSAKIHAKIHVLLLSAKIHG